MNNDRNKSPSGTEDKGQLTFHNTDIDAELRIVRGKIADLIRTKQILEQTDQQKEVPLINNSMRGRIIISAGGNAYFPLRDLSDRGTISTATSLLSKDLKLRRRIGDPNAN